MKRKVTDRQRASCVKRVQVGVQNDLARKSVPSYGSTPRYHPDSPRFTRAQRTSSLSVSELSHVWTGAPGDRRKVDGASPSREGVASYNLSLVGDWSKLCLPAVRVPAAWPPRGKDLVGGPWRSNEAARPTVVPGLPVTVCLAYLRPHAAASA